MTWAETVARPNGTVYRARKSPRVEQFGDHGEDSGFLVVRTHDIDVAVALVARYWSWWHGTPLPGPRLRWVNLVPWDDYTGYDRSWIDLEPGERGATPAVEFRYEDH